MTKRITGFVILILIILSSGFIMHEKLINHVYAQAQLSPNSVTCPSGSMPVDTLAGRDNHGLLVNNLCISTTTGRWIYGQLTDINGNTTTSDANPGMSFNTSIIHFINSNFYTDNNASYWLFSSSIGGFWFAGTSTSGQSFRIQDLHINLNRSSATAPGISGSGCSLGTASSDSIGTIIATGADTCTVSYGLPFGANATVMLQPLSSVTATLSTEGTNGFLMGTSGAGSVNYLVFDRN